MAWLAWFVLGRNTVTTLNSQQAPQTEEVSSLNVLTKIATIPAVAPAAPPSPSPAPPSLEPRLACSAAWCWWVHMYFSTLGQPAVTDDLTVWLLETPGPAGCLVAVLTAYWQSVSQNRLAVSSCDYDWSAGWLGWEQSYYQHINNRTVNRVTHTTTTTTTTSVTLRHGNKEK